MAIKKIRVKNFKSFDDLEIELKDFNVLIGVNASGKSNFINIFKFLKDTTNSKLYNAIWLQGGSDYFWNLNIGSSKEFSIEISSDDKIVLPIEMVGEKIKKIALSYEIIYEFNLRMNKEKDKIVSTKDILKLNCDIYDTIKQDKNILLNMKLGEGKIIIENKDGKLIPNFNLQNGIKCKTDFVKSLLTSQSSISLNNETHPSKTLMIEPEHLTLPNFDEIFKNISVFNFDPYRLKQEIIPKKKVDFDEDGSNLPIVLRKILEDKKNYAKFFNLLKELINFAEDIRIKSSGERIILELKELYFKKEYIPSLLISDGTASVIAMIVALYFDNSRISIIEEPERNIHPYLISKVIDMMKDAARNKQIIITTHNPEIVKYAGLENLLLITRDKKGFSKISRPSDKREIQIFLENQMGLDELYVQNLLEI